MNWFTHNPIAQMDGPHFLLLYGFVILVVLVVCGIMRATSDPTANESLPPIPTDPDPYELSYLRGGANEVIRTIIFNLIQRGYLTVVEPSPSNRAKEQPRPIAQADPLPDRSLLTDLERTVFEWFRLAMTPAQLFSLDRSGRLTSLLEPYERKLREASLLASPIQLQRLSRLWLTGMAVIWGLGGYKLLIALAKGKHNVGFLILMGIVAVIILTVICARTGRLSARGQAYLSRLQLAYSRLNGSSSTRSETAVAGAPLLVLTGIFGVTALEGTEFGYYHQMFRRSTVAGGSCGSSCGGGGSWGGGGGCGGGGCGGCGGG